MLNVNKDIEISSTLSSEFYSSQDIFNEVVENIFVTSWHLISDDSYFGEENYAFPFFLMDEVLPEPLFLVKNKNGIECFSNVCTHRGNILIKKHGKIKKTISCNYHGRSFDNMGNFLYSVSFVNQHFFVHRPVGFCYCMQHIFLHMYQYIYLIHTVHFLIQYNYPP